MKLKISSYHLCYYQILIFSISHLWSGTDSQQSGYSINVPRRVTVQRGLCVFIPCKFTVPEAVTLTRNATGIWYHAERGQIVASNTNSVHRINDQFFLVEDVWRGDCNLYIEDPVLLDEGHYLFRVEGNVKYTYRDIQLYVQVTELKSKPEISPIKSWLDGEEVTLSCTSPGTCVRKTPQITWEGNIQNRSVENQVINHKNGTRTHRSTITFTARKEQNNSTLACIVRLNEGLTTRQQIILKVESKSKTISELKSHCKITGNNMECTCIVQSFSEAIIQWKIDDQFYDSSDKDIRISTSRSDLVINSTLSLQLSQKDIPHIICMSSNNYGDPVQCKKYYGVIGGIVAGILIILLLIALGAFWYVKRHVKKKLGNNGMIELGDARGTECVYEDLQNPTNSIYNTIQGSQQ